MRLPRRLRPSGRDIRVSLLDSVLLAVACLVSYWLVADLLARLHSISAPDDIVGGLWAVIATIFVTKDSYERSLAAGISRIAGTLVSFAVCLIYLSFLPFHVWALPLLIWVSAVIPMLAGRPGDAATAGITTAVLLALTEITPQDAWEQPILRLADTVVGVVIGVAAAWLGRRLIGRPSGHDQKT